MGRLATGIRALGKSSGVEVNVLKDTPGPQRTRAWKSWESGDLGAIADLWLLHTEVYPLCRWPVETRWVQRCLLGTQCQS